MRATLSLFLVLLTLGLAGCGSISSVLLPLATTPPGPPTRGRVQIRVRETTNTGTATSSCGAGSGAYLPRVQLGGGVGIRLNRHFALRIHGASLLDIDAQSISTCTGSAPRRSGFFVGASPTFLFPLDHGRSGLVLSIDAAGALIPTERSDPEFGSSGDFDGGILLGGTVGAYRWLADWFLLRGTAGLRSQPGSPEANEPGPTGLGYLAVVVGGEAQFQFTPEFFLSVETQWVGAIAPYAVFPTVEITLGGTLGDGPAQTEDPLDPDTWITPEE